MELLQNNFDSKEEAFKYLVEFVDKNGAKVVQHKKNMKQLKSELVKEKCEKQKLAIVVQEQKAKIELLESKLANLSVSNAAVCAVASVSPRCEATNLANDRVEMLEKANSKFNKIIRSFTSSQQSLNDLVSCLGRNSQRQRFRF